MPRPRLSDAEREFGRLLGRAIAERRVERNLTSEALARQAEARIDHLRALERGRIPNPGVISVARIAGALGVTIDSLVPAQPTLKRREDT